MRHVATQQRAGGFSLVEVLIVVVTVAIAVAISVPAIGSAQKKRATRVAANEFVELHGQARAAAVKYGRLVELHIDNSTSRLWIQADTADSGSPDTLGVVRDLGRRYIRVKSSNAMVCFDASGSASTRGSCGTGLNVIAFEAGSYVDTVRVTAAGNVLR